MKNRIIDTIEAVESNCSTTYAIEFAYFKYGCENGHKIYELNKIISIDDQTTKATTKIGNFLHEQGLSCVNLKRGRDKTTFIFCNETVLVTIITYFKNMSISALKLGKMSNKFEETDPFINTLEKFIDELQGFNECEISVLDNFCNAQGLGRGGLKLIRENYSESVLEGFDYLVKQFSSPKPSGRLAILQGVPGTGKTHLIRGLVDKIGNKNDLWLLIDADVLNQERTLNNIILKHKYRKRIFLLIEDADKSLVSRSSRSNVANLSNALNLTDGLAGDLLDVCVIATTNAKSIEIDDALLRNGRLCKMIDVDLLKPERAAMVYKRLSGKDKEYKNSVRLGDIYSEVFS